MIAPKYFFLDVDGVMTTGEYFYTVDGKAMKIFGPDDHDALLLLKPYMKIQFVTGDRKGFEISRRRIVEDMKMPLELVSTHHRLQWISERVPLSEAIYMGDGIFDGAVFEGVGYSIAPADAFYETRAKAAYVTTSPGGRRAVAEACVHLLNKFFALTEPTRLSINGGEWGQ